MGFLDERVEVKVTKVTEKYCYFGSEGKSIAMRSSLEGVKVGDTIEIVYDWTRKLGPVVSVKIVEVGNVKDVVSTLSGSTPIGMHQYEWMVQTVLTAEGMYYAIVHFGSQVTSTPEVATNDLAKDAGCQKLASWVDEVKKKVGV